MYYLLPCKNPGERRSLLSSYDGVRVSVYDYSAAVLHGHLIALAHSARSFARAFVDTQIQSVPVLSRPKKQLLLAACGADLLIKTKNLVQGESNPSVPHPPTASHPPPSSSNPASCRRSSLHANQDCAVDWVVLAPATAHEHPD